MYIYIYIYYIFTFVHLNYSFVIERYGVSRFVHLNLAMLLCNWLTRWLHLVKQVHRLPKGNKYGDPPNLLNLCSFCQLPPSLSALLTLSVLCLLEMTSDASALLNSRISEMWPLLLL